MFFNKYPIVEMMPSHEPLLVYNFECVNVFVQYLEWFVRISEIKLACFGPMTVQAAIFGGDVHVSL